MVVVMVVVVVVVGGGAGAAMIHAFKFALHSPSRI